MVTEKVTANVEIFYATESLYTEQSLYGHFLVTEKVMVQPCLT
jgi:hypothetical protein